MTNLTLNQILNTVQETTPPHVGFARHFTYLAEGISLSVVLFHSEDGYRYDNHTLDTALSFAVKNSTTLQDDCLFARKKTAFPFHQSCQIIQHLLNTRKY